MKFKTALRNLLIGLLFTTPAWSYQVQRTIQGQDALRYDISMEQNENVRIPDEDLILVVSHVADSRCPQDVTCIWEGDIRATVEIKRASSEEFVGEFELSNHVGKPGLLATFENSTLSLIGVEKSGTIKLQLTRKIESCDEFLTGMCTMEFMPVICQYGELTVKGSNMCDGRKRMQYQACLQNNFLVVDEKLCKPLRSPRI